MSTEKEARDVLLQIRTIASVMAKHPGDDGLPLAAKHHFGNGYHGEKVGPTHGLMGKFFDIGSRVAALEVEIRQTIRGFEDDRKALVRA